MKTWRMTPDHAAAWRDIRLEALATAPDSYGTRLSDWQGRPLRDFAARLAAVPTFAAGETEALPLAAAGWEPDYGGLPHRAWLISLYARPAGRGRGYATAVIARICGEVAALGMTEIALNVGVANAAARALYARLGFAETGQPAQPNENGVAELPMLRPLRDF